MNFYLVTFLKIIMYQLSVIYLVLYTIGGLVANTILDQGVISFNESKFYERFSTDVSMEQFVPPAEIIEISTPSIRDDTLNKNILTNALASADNTIETDLSFGNNLNNTDLDHLLLKFDDDDGISCILDEIKITLLWWTFPNGTLRVTNFNITPKINHLDLSYRNISSDEALYGKARNSDSNQIVVFSAAYNNLTSVPRQTLEIIGTKLKYLTLSGNQFAAYTPEVQMDVINRLINETNYNNSSIDNGFNQNYYCNTLDENLQHSDNQTEHAEVNNKLFSKKGEGIAWATFPYLPNLIELDISNCHIEYVTKDAFRNLTQLESLYISHNKMLTIPFDTFYYIQTLQYLDLSFTNVFDYNYQISLPTLEAIINLIYGVKIQQTTFKYLPNLVYLDLSHTKLTRNSAVAFTHLGERLKYLSLCYTAFPMIGNAIFKNTALIGLDLSGNPYAAYNILDDVFEGVSDTLCYLYFEHSNLKDLEWLKYLNNLRVLGLAGNNINSVTLDKFSPLHSLQMLDLSSNHVGNWYTRVFLKNENLRVLNLRDNNINIITSEMLKDFSLLDYLSLGDNNFVCDCMLRELIDLSAENNQNEKCSRNIKKGIQEFIIQNTNIPFNNQNFNTLRDWSKNIAELELKYRFGDLDVDTIFWSQHLIKFKQKISSFVKLNNSRSHIKMRFVFDTYSSIMLDMPNKCAYTGSQTTHLFDKLNGSILKFQLLDYDEEHYWCFNETEKLSFVQLNCQQRSFVGEIADQLNTLTTYIMVCVGTLFAVTFLGLVVYWKRWHIHYYYSSLKSAALMSVAAKDNENKFNALAEHDPNMIYDMFISYCQNDRDWVLEELMPNVEETGDISICLHERDFQIGVTILDNIVSCMERSRALMLIISSNFLLSHWCQFEMHLAQHRIFDVSKEHLILVFLEDIPRSKRPKNLQYLMDVKTYIKWPGGKGTKGIQSDDRRLFWKRLRRSLLNIGLNPIESRA